jgi:hypothetical protein
MNEEYVKAVVGQLKDSREFIEHLLSKDPQNINIYAEKMSIDSQIERISQKNS